jgi:hypothetical protein
LNIRHAFVTRLASIRSQKSTDLLNSTLPPQYFTI